jgi:hypothetical protein
MNIELKRYKINNLRKIRMSDNDIKLKKNYIKLKQKYNKCNINNNFNRHI